VLLAGQPRQPAAAELQQQQQHGQEEGNEGEQQQLEQQPSQPQQQALEGQATPFTRAAGWDTPAARHAALKHALKGELQLCSAGCGSARGASSIHAHNSISRSSSGSTAVHQRMLRVQHPSRYCSKFSGNLQQLCRLLALRGCSVGILCVWLRTPPTHPTPTCNRCWLQGLQAGLQCGRAPGGLCGSVRASNRSRLGCTEGSGCGTEPNARKAVTRATYQASVQVDAAVTPVP
jgi:hypothetical protein